MIPSLTLTGTDRVLEIIEKDEAFAKARAARSGYQARLRGTFRYFPAVGGGARPVPALVGSLAGVLPATLSVGLVTG